MKRAFKTYLIQLLEPRGAAAELARNSGVSPGQISRLAEGDSLPEPATFAKLIAGMSQSDRNAITVAYLKDHRPDLAAEVQIIGGDQSELKDRLTAACEKLDARTRDALAIILDGVNRAPEQGVAWLRSMAALFAPPTPTADLALAAEQTSPSNITTKRHDVIYPKPPRKRK